MNSKVGALTYALYSHQPTLPMIWLLLAEEGLATLLENILSTKGYRVVRTLQTHLNEWQDKEPDIVVADLCPHPPKRIQELALLKPALGNPPIICVASLDDREIVLNGSQLGIDDFVFRPFELTELETRLHILLAKRNRAPEQALSIQILERRQLERRRIGLPPGSPEGPQGIPDFHIDDRVKQVRIGGKLIPLSRREYQLLRLLATEPGRVFSIEEIIRRIWPPNSKAMANDVQQFIHLLRRKIEDCPSQPQWIRTVKGFGYLLTVDHP